MKRLKLELAAALADYPALKAQVAKQYEAEKEDDKQIAEAVRTGRETDERTMRQLSDAHLRKLMRPSKREALENRLASEFQKIRELASRLVEYWNILVRQKAEEDFDNLMVAIRPWYGGEGKEVLTKREFEHVHIPRIAEIRRCQYSDCGILTDDMAPALMEHAVLQHAEGLLAKIDRSCAAFRWALPDETRKREIPSLPDKAYKVTVRAKGGMQHEKVKNRFQTARLGVHVDEEFIANGQTAEVTRGQYEALSTFLELVKDPTK